MTVGEDKFHSVAVWAWQGLHKERAAAASLEKPGWSVTPTATPHKAVPRMVASARGPQAEVLACCAGGRETALVKKDNEGMRSCSFVTCGVKHLKVWI